MEYSQLVMQSSRTQLNTGKFQKNDKGIGQLVTWKVGWAGKDYRIGTARRARCATSLNKQQQIWGSVYIHWHFSSSSLSRSCTVPYTKKAGLMLGLVLVTV